jgi:hypothetical protein
VRLTDCTRAEARRLSLLDQRGDAVFRSRKGREQVVDAVSGLTMNIWAVAGWRSALSFGITAAAPEIF